MTQATEEISELVNEMSNTQINTIAKSLKKSKATIYLTEEAEHAFTELYIARYRKNKRIDRSTIACEALQALYEKEFPKSDSDCFG